MSTKPKSDHERVSAALRQRGITDPVELLQLVDRLDENATIVRDNVLVAAVMALASSQVPLLVGRDACDIAESVMRERKKRWGL